MTTYSYKKAKKILQQLRIDILFLGLIPDSIYFNLDPREFHLPDQKISRLRKELEERLGHYVMVYNHMMFCRNIPVKRHLCANVQGAILTKKQQKTLDEYEQKVRKDNVSFVVYQKPLELIDPMKNSFFSNQKLNLCRVNFVFLEIVRCRHSTLGLL